MTAFDAKADLHLYLQDARDALLWKLDGLSEYDVRRPLTPSGTNLLGLVKHVTAAEAVYFGETFGRPFEAAPLWIAGRAEPNADLWATPQESREEIVGLYHRVWAHSDETVRSLPLDATGRVGWGRRAEVTLHRILVHAIAETDRHAGHADIVRELVDGGRGLRAQDGNLPEGRRRLVEGPPGPRRAGRARGRRPARPGLGRTSLADRGLTPVHRPLPEAVPAAKTSVRIPEWSDRQPACTTLSTSTTCCD